LSQRNAGICLARTAATVGCFLLDACIRSRCWAVIVAPSALMRVHSHAQVVLLEGTSLLGVCIPRPLDACIHPMHFRRVLVCYYCGHLVRCIGAVHTRCAACRIGAACSRCCADSRHRLRLRGTTNAQQMAVLVPALLPIATYVAGCWVLWQVYV
jgi:hypothetical protein